VTLEKFFKVVGRYQRPRSNFEYWKFTVSYSLVEKAATESSCFAGIFNAVAELVGSLHVTKSCSVVRLDCRENRWILALREYKIASIKWAI